MPKALSETMSSDFVPGEGCVVGAFPEKLFCVSVAVKVNKAEYWAGRLSTSPIREHEAIALALVAPDADCAQTLALFHVRDAFKKRGLCEVRDYTLLDWNAVEVGEGELRGALAGMEAGKADPPAPKEAVHG